VATGSVSTTKAIKPLFRDPKPVHPTLSEAPAGAGNGTQTPEDAARARHW
jgi:hypothetical protein